MSIPTPIKRISDFESLGFGMFIHFGLYSLLGKGEWVMYRENLDKTEYRKLAEKFSLEKFDAREWVRTAKRAGMKYIVLTSRHHEGFSLYDTKGLNDYDAPHSAYGKDIIREFVDACNEEGILPFFYHTTLDWDHPDFYGDFPKYLEYLRRSVEIVCTQYGKIGGLWFDGNWSRKDMDWEEDKLYALIRKYQPDAIIVNNTGITARGNFGNAEIDSVTFEQGRPGARNLDGAPKYVAAEMCQTMNLHWGCGNSDFMTKSLPELIETLAYCRRMGVNYLLNVGPLGDGSLDSLQTAILEKMGEWVEYTGDGIYGGRPFGVTCPDNEKDFALKTENDVRLYVHGLAVTGITNVTADDGVTGWREYDGINEKIKSVRWSDNGEELKFEQIGDKLRVHCTGYPYGRNIVVRCAVCETE